MTFCQEQPIISSVFDQPPASLHQPLLQAGERQVANSLRQHQPPPQVPEVEYPDGQGDVREKSQARIAGA
jgi:hypothetical protein